MTTQPTEFPASVKATTSAARLMTAMHRLRDSDTVHALVHSRTALPATLCLLVVLVCTFGAPWIAPYNPQDLATVDLLDAQMPPAWAAGGSASHVIGTDEQGRDLLSAIIYGARTSLGLGLACVALAGAIGITLGLMAGYLGGFVDALAMRAADVQMTIPDVMLALLVTGILHAVLPRGSELSAAPVIIVLAVGISNWPQFARVVRACTMAERSKDYVAAAFVTGVHPARILFGHVLLNVAGPICILATQGIASAVLAESALSFIGVGMPVTEPSLGTLIRVGNSYLYSGEWWTTAFPALALSVTILSINVLGDWLKDHLNPKLG